MKFRCQDLPNEGVVLIPADSQAFRPLFADIRRHLESPPPGGPPELPGDPDPLPEGNDPAGAILWNQSDRFICAESLIWKYQETGGHEYQSSSVMGVGATPSLLLPFGMPEDRRQFTTYWHTILPNSKRYLSEGSVFGTNADVRPPAPEEIWKGGIMRWGGPREHLPVEPLRNATLVLDGVFFSSGECAGPDEMHLWEQILCAAGVHRELAWAAREGVAAGLEPGEILARMARITGSAGGPPPPPPPPPRGPIGAETFRARERHSLARLIEARQRSWGDERTVSMLVGWAETVLPQYRRI